MAESCCPAAKLVRRRSNHGIIAQIGGVFSANLRKVAEAETQTQRSHGTHLDPISNFFTLHGKATVLTHQIRSGHGSVTSKVFVMTWMLLLCTLLTTMGYNGCRKACEELLCGISPSKQMSLQGGRTIAANRETSHGTLRAKAAPFRL